MTSVAGHIAQELVSAVRPNYTLFHETVLRLDHVIRLLEQPFSPERDAEVFAYLREVSRVMLDSRTVAHKQLQGLCRSQPVFAHQWAYESLMRLGSSFEHDRSADQTQLVDPGKVLPAQYNILAFAWFEAHVVEFVRFMLRLSQGGGHPSEFAFFQTTYPTVRVCRSVPRSSYNLAESVRRTCS